MDNSAFRKIGQFQYSSEAYVYKTRLESDGIDVFMRDNNTIDSDPLVSTAIGGVKLFVRQEDYESAASILAEISPYSLEDDGDIKKCPNCGAEKVQLFTTIMDLKSLLAFAFGILISVFPFYNKYKYRCRVCHYEFSH